MEKELYCIVCNSKRIIVRTIDLGTGYGLSKEILPDRGSRLSETHVSCQDCKRKWILGEFKKGLRQPFIWKGHGH